MSEPAEPQQITIMRRLVEMSAERSYMNAERTLAVWIRTALALMTSAPRSRCSSLCLELPCSSS